MIRSMTGFGAASHQGRRASVTVELRSVNSRHLKVGFRLPAGGEAWEASLRTQLADAVSRGQVDVSVRVDERAEESGLGAVGGGADGCHDVSESVEIGELSAATSAALSQLIAMREAEGARLETELRARIDAVRDGLGRAEPRIPVRLQRERERLLAAVRDLTDGAQLDEERVAREIALIADRWDVGEEMVRARAHLDAFVELLDTPTAEPVGKRLSFLIQEIHREINTLGAKANDVQITREVVEMKNEIEKLREQVENVE